MFGLYVFVILVWLVCLLVFEIYCGVIILFWIKDFFENLMKSLSYFFGDK